MGSFYTKTPICYSTTSTRGEFMDGCVMNGWMMDEWMDEWDGWIIDGGWIDGLLNRCIKAWSVDR